MRVFITKNTNGAELPTSEIKLLPVNDNAETMHLFGNTIAIKIRVGGFADERKEHYTATDGKTYRITFNYPMVIVDEEWEEIDV